MKREFLIFLAVCTFAAAMVPRDKRAVNSEEEEELLRSQTTTTTTTDKPPLICAPQTACGWSMYKAQSKNVRTDIPNSYCMCSEDTVCQKTKEDLSINAYVLYCRPPVEDDEEEDDSS